MTRFEYLENYNAYSSTLMGVVSLCESIEEVRKYLAVYQPKLDEIYIQRIHSIAGESGWTKAELDKVLEMIR